MVIIEPTAKDDLRELVADLMAITTAFSARIYGKRGDKKVATTVRQAMATLAEEGDSVENDHFGVLLDVNDDQELLGENFIPFLGLRPSRKVRMNAC